MKRRSLPVFSIMLDKVEDFLQDSIRFRDPKACTRTPSLRYEETYDGMDKLHVFGRFLMHHDYVIQKSSGKRFVDITKDSNDIHKIGNVVPGAMTISKIILPLEILMPELEVSDANFKFTSSSIYEEKTRNVFSFQFIDAENMRIEVNTFQSQKIVAKTVITGRINYNKEQVAMIEDEDVNEKGLNLVREYFNTLNIEGEAYIQKVDYRDYTYPLSYIAALPSGEIVKQMEGNGGMLNLLRLNFGSLKMIPITNEKGPEVRLERARERSNFNKIITEIANDLVTYYRGLAIVSPLAKFRNSTNSIISPAK